MKIINNLNESLFNFQTPGVTQSRPQPQRTHLRYICYCRTTHKWRNSTYTHMRRPNKRVADCNETKTLLTVVIDDMQSVCVWVNNMLVLCAPAIVTP
jgi:hypothetical protein